jgi:hypothetical protein
MPPSKTPPAITDLAQLDPACEPAARHFLRLLQEHELPYVVAETRRTVARQKALYDKGVSKAAGANGPHPWGLALDVILDHKSRYWAGKTKPMTAGGVITGWDTGYDVTPDGRAVLMREDVRFVVAAFGWLAKEAGLEWGGVNAGPWRSARTGDEFGSDPFHFQMPNWRKRADSGVAKLTQK